MGISDSGFWISAFSRRGLSTLVAAALVAAATAETEEGVSLVIVSAGKPMATIVVAANASEPVRNAVADLQSYIEKMSGAKLTVEHVAEGPGNRILVGRMAAVEKLIPDLDTYDLGDDGLVIRSFPKTLVLTGQSDGFTTPWTGASDCGTPNAVYGFLESLGCRWYMPGADGEVVPRKATIEVPGIDIVSKPDFLSRVVGGWAAARVSPEVERDFRVWAKRNRLGKNSYHEGHSLTGLLNPKEYFKRKPDCFALVDGKRQSGYAQICTSNPEAVDLVSRNLHQMVAGRPPQGWRSYPVGQNDSSLWCECEQCRALDGDTTFAYDEIDGARVVGTGPGAYRNIANRYLIFVNTVAERFEKSYPDCLITYYGYYCLPGFPEVKPRDNVLPVMTHFWDNERSRKMIDDWAEISKHLYYYGYVGYKFSLPKFGIVEDIRWCHGKKGVGMTFAEDEHSPLNMVTCYLIARAMWDVNVDAPAVLADFYEKYYSVAAAPMRLFFETFDEATRQATREWDIHASYPATLTPARVAECRDHLSAARTAADGQALITRRIEAMSSYWRVVELHVGAQQAIEAWRAGKSAATRQAVHRASNDLIEIVESLRGVCHYPQRIYRAEGWLREVDE